MTRNTHACRPRASRPSDAVLAYKSERLQELLARNGPLEVLARMYAIPEYRSVLDAHLAQLTRTMTEDAALLDAFLDLLRDAGVDIDEEVRIIPAVIGAAAAWKIIAGSAAVGAVIGVAAGLADDD